MFLKRLWFFTCFIIIYTIITDSSVMFSFVYIALGSFDCILVVFVFAVWLCILLAHFCYYYLKRVSVLPGSFPLKINPLINRENIFIDVYAILILQSISLWERQRNILLKYFLKNDFTSLCISHSQLRHLIDHDHNTTTIFRLAFCTQQIGWLSKLVAVRVNHTAEM